jgi:recombination protein RecT
MGKVAQMAQGQEMVRANPRRDMRELITRQWTRIESVMPKHMSGERLYQLAITTINQMPKLAECDPGSMLSCLMKCSALGLEPGSVDGLGRAYILPFRDHGKMTATFILGYKGMLDLARRSGELKDISARAVYEGDEFEYEFGLDEKLRHVPSTRKHEKGQKPTHVYMVAHFKDGGHYMDVMTADEVEAIRLRSKSKDSGPWVTDYEAMAKKSVIRRAFPYLPVSVEAQQAAAADETTPDYSGVLAPVIPEASEEPSEAPVEVSVDVEPQEGETGPRKAVCKSCGNVVEVAPDASPEDLAGIGCCGAPDYGWE